MRLQRRPYWAHLDGPCSDACYEEVPDMPDNNPTLDETAEAVLVAHQRRDLGSCLCGWSELGKSHPRHQVAMLREAGIFAKETDHVTHDQTVN